MGITNSAGTLPGIAGPLVVGLLTNDKPTRVQWQKVFYISAGLFVFGWIIYLLIGSGKQQSWNTPYEDLLVPIEIPREPRKPVMADILADSEFGFGSDGERSYFSSRAEC